MLTYVYLHGSLWYTNGMIYVNEKYNTEVEFPRILAQYFEGLKIGVFDIETTGLSPDYCAFILGGLGTADGRERLPGAGTGMDMLRPARTPAKRQRLRA